MSNLVTTQNISCYNDSAVQLTWNIDIRLFEMDCETSSSLHQLLITKAIRYTYWFNITVDVTNSQTSFINGRWVLTCHYTKCKRLQRFHIMDSNFFQKITNYEGRLSQFYGLHSSTDNYVLDPERMKDKIDLDRFWTYNAESDEVLQRILHSTVEILPTTI